MCLPVASRVVRRHPVRTALCLLCGLVAFASLLARPLPAQALLRVPSTAPHAPLWNHAYQMIPAVWKSGRLVVVREVSADEMERIVTRLGGQTENTMGDDSIVDGCFQAGGEHEDDPATISLVDSLHGDEAELVFTHEYGHFVWDEFLSEGQRAKYVRLWRQQKRDGHLVTRYAGDSEEEGFAESFAHFLRKPALLRSRDARSFQYLQDLTASLHPRS